jgi:hypothetical protein
MLASPDEIHADATTITRVLGVLSVVGTARKRPVMRPNSERTDRPNLLDVLAHRPADDPVLAIVDRPEFAAADVPIGRGPGVADAVVRARHSVLDW